MVEIFTPEVFLPLVDLPFHVCDAPRGDRVDLRLVSVERSRVSSNDGRARAIAEGRMRQPFVLTFCGPLDAPLAQRIYQMEHERLGRFPLFIVPIAADESGRLYEVVFT